MATYDAYDIECLMHVYNKFGKADKPHITDVTQLFCIDSFMTCMNLTQNQPCTISDQFADFLGQPHDTILTIREITNLFREYCHANNLFDLNNGCIWRNEALCNLLNINTNNNYFLMFISTFIKDCINLHHIQIIMPHDGSYVLK
jgi:hypothetical protein